MTQDDERGLKWTALGVSANGEQFSYSFEGAPDGKDYSMKSQAVIGFTRAYGRIGGTLQAVDKRNGQVIQTSTTTVSNDGRTMTILFVRSASDMTWTEVLDHVK